MPNVTKPGTTFRMPWGLALFLLATFGLMFDPSFSGGVKAVNIGDYMQAVLKGGNTLREISLLTLGVFALITFLNRRRDRLQANGPLAWLLLFFLGLAVASPAWAQDPAVAIRRVVVLVLLSAGAAAVVARCPLLRIAALTVCVCGFTVIISLAVEIASGAFRPLDGSWRFSGVLHPVVQGWNCGLLVIASLVLAVALPRSRMVFIFVALVGFVFLGLTRSRMPLASTILACAVCGSFISSRARRLSFASAYFLVCVGLLWFLLGGNIGKTAVAAATLGRGKQAAASLDTFTGRLELWDAELGYVKERPVLGYGYDSFFNPRNIPSIAKAAGWVATSPHSGYIGTLLGLGYVGLATLVLTLLAALKRSLSQARHRPEVAFAAAVTIWLCCNLFLESAIITDPSFPTFICLAILVSLSFKRVSRPSTWWFSHAEARQ